MKPQKITQTIQLGTIITLAFTVWIWHGLLTISPAQNAVYFLNVGQGDAQLITLASSNSKKRPVKILIDAGAGRQVITALEEVLGRENNKYIDVLIMTHPHLDHYGGFIDILHRYQVGMFISNGQTAETPAFQTLQEQLTNRNITSLILRENDLIRYQENLLLILSPDIDLLNAGNVDEASLVIMLESNSARVLFTGDLGIPGENVLLDKNHELKADVLKVGHHGSKNSSGENFLAAVRPHVSVIGVGSRNRYGHPAPRVLEALKLAGSKIYRTDLDGTIKIILDPDK